MNGLAWGFGARSDMWTQAGYGLMASRARLRAFAHSRWAIRVNRKSSLAGAFCNFLAETVELISAAGTCLHTGFRRYRQMPYPHSYPQKKSMLPVPLFQHALDFTPVYISLDAFSKKKQLHNVANAFEQVRKRQAPPSVGLREWDGTGESNRHGCLPGFSGASAPFAQDQ